MPFISEHEKRKAEAFTNSLNSILELVENLVGVIGEGNYLAIANHLKILHDNKSRTEIIQTIRENIHTQVERVRTNETREWLEKRSKMEIIAGRLTEEARRSKMKDLKRCVKCDRMVMKNYMKTHQKSSVCSDIYNTKNLTCKMAKTQVNKYHDAIACIRSWCLQTGRYNKFVGCKPMD